MGLRIQALKRKRNGEKVSLAAAAKITHHPSTKFLSLATNSLNAFDATNHEINLINNVKFFKPTRRRRHRRYRRLRHLTRLPILTRPILTRLRRLTSLRLRRSSLAYASCRMLSKRTPYSL